MSPVNNPLTTSASAAQEVNRPDLESGPFGDNDMFDEFNQEEIDGVPQPDEKWHECLFKPSPSWTFAKRKGTLYFLAFCGVWSTCMINYTGCASVLHMWCAVFMTITCGEQLQQEMADRMDNSLYWQDRRH